MFQEEDKNNIAFTRQFHVIPFDCNLRATNGKSSKRFVGQKYLVYLDNIKVFGKSFDEHIECSKLQERKKLACSRRYDKDNRISQRRNFVLLLMNTSIEALNLAKFSRVTVLSHIKTTTTRRWIKWTV